MNTRQNYNGNPEILVIGDHPAVTVSLRTMLSLGELGVVTTAEPGLAIQIVQSPDARLKLALIDVRTVDIDPLVLAERLREVSPRLQILYFSSLVDGEVIRLGIIDPTRNVLRKEGVIAAIEEALADQEADVPKTMTAGTPLAW